MDIQQQQQHQQPQQACQLQQPNLSVPCALTPALCPLAPAPACYVPQQQSPMQLPLSQQPQPQVAMAFTSGPAANTLAAPLDLTGSLAPEPQPISTVSSVSASTPNLSDVAAVQAQRARWIKTRPRTTGARTPTGVALGMRRSPSAAPALAGIVPFLLSTGPPTEPAPVPQFLQPKASPPPKPAAAPAQQPTDSPLKLPDTPHKYTVIMPASDVLKPSHQQAKKHQDEREVPVHYNPMYESNQRTRLNPLYESDSDDSDSDAEPAQARGRRHK